MYANNFIGNVFGFDHGGGEDGMFPDDMFTGFAESSFHFEGHSSGKEYYVLTAT